MTEDTTQNLDLWADRLATVLDRATRTRTNETELREDAEGVIRDALADLYSLPLEAITAETNTRPDGQGRRPVDKIYGGVLVEYEWEMGAARRRHGSDQALDYLHGLESKTGAAGAFTAVVTDGREWGFLIEHPDEQLDLFGTAPVNPEDHFEWRANSAASCRRFLQLCGSHPKIPVTGTALANAFGPTNENVQRLVGLLALALEGRSAGDRADTLLQEWKRSTEIAYGSLDSIHADLLTELRTAFNVPAGACRNFQELLFVIHTYFALIARLVAVEVLAIALDEHDSRPSTWPSYADYELAARMIDFDAGNIPSALTIENLFESDVFSWYVDILPGDIDLTAALRLILDQLAGFAFPPVAYGAHRATDNLRELYQRLIPRSLRKLLGEFLTPFWLAEASLSRLRDNGAPVDTGRILDPTCGTGTFLLPLLRSRAAALRSAKGGDITSDDVQRLLDGFAGFDINPIAVTATRANFIVALGSLAEVGHFHLPIWRTDSLVMPEPQPAQGDLTEPRLQDQDYVELPTSLPDPFPVPSSVTTSSQVTAIRSALEATIRHSTPEEGRAAFIRELTQALHPDTGSLPLTIEASDWSNVTAVLEVLYDRVRVLADTGRNGVWARIIENAFAPLFSGKFDVVVGNPPWLGWPKLPERWRKRAEKLWKRYGLWSVPRTSGEQGKPFAQFNDVATLVYATALARYATEKGFVGLLVPEALTIADPGARAFRKFHLISEAGETGTDVEFRILYCDNWRRVKPFGADAANNPIFLIAQRDTTQVFPVPTSQWERSAAGTQLRGTEWGKVQLQLSEITGESNPVNRAVSYSAWSFAASGTALLEGGTNDWSFGMGVNTRGAAGIFYVDVLSANRPQGTVKVRNRPTEGRNASVRARTRSIEAALVHPLLRGRDIEAWDARPSGYIVVPQDPSDLKYPLTEDQMRRRFPEALKWLQTHAGVLRKRSAPNRSWTIAGPDWFRLQGSFDYLIGGYLVVVPEQRMPPPAAVATPSYDLDLGRKALALPNHKVVFCAVPTLDEALYLTGVINSTQMQTLLGSFASQTAISPTTMARLPIPSYAPKSPDVQEVVQASQKIHAAEDKSETRSSEQARIDAAVERMLNASGVTTGASPTPPPAGKRPRKRAHAPARTPLPQLDLGWP